MREATIKKLTYRDYAKIPDDGQRYQVIEGELFMTPVPEVRHQRVSRKLLVLLTTHVEKHALGEVLVAPIDVLLSKHDIVQPDIVFVSTARAKIITKKNLRGAPDLLIEILSPSTASIDRHRKLRLYERAGVKEYWIVDPGAQTVEIHEFRSPRKTRVYDGDRSFQSELVPGLTVRLRDIF